jgi:Uncharacterised nucleotidyltransferase
VSRGDRRADHGARRHLLLAAAGATVGTPADRAGLERALAVADRAGLVLAATFHGVAPALHLVLRDVTAVPDDLAADLERAYHGCVAFHLGVLEDVAYLAETLGAAGVPWLVLKGPVLGELHYEHPHVRPYSDVDVLVAPGAIGDAVEALERNGCRFDDTWPVLRDGPTGELSARLPSGRSLDLHWHLVNQPRIRRRLAVAVPPLLSRARDVTLGRTTVRTLSPADTLAHLSLHACTSGADRLVWLTDIVRCMQVEGRDCAGHVDVSAGWGTSRLAAMSLRRAWSVVGDGAPADVAALVPRPSLWLGAAGLLDRTVPAADHADRPALAHLVARSTRPTGRASAVELARRTTFDARRRALGALRPGGGRSAPDDAGDRRPDWLRAVAAETSSSPLVRRSAVVGAPARSATTETSS